VTPAGTSTWLVTVLILFSILINALLRWCGGKNR